MVTLHLLFSIANVAHAAAVFDYAQYVNPLIGSEGAIPGQAFGGGDIFVGGAVPFGMVKVGIDTFEEPVNISVMNGGYTPRGWVTGISLLHESGTGGGPKYGFPAQMPLTTIEAPVNVLDNHTYWQRRVGPESVSVGHYGVELENGVHLELSASRHAGIMRYNFPSDEKHVLVDLSHYLPYNTRAYDSQFYVGGEIEISNNGSLYTGYTSIAGGWNLGAPTTVFFCGDFNTPPSEARTFTGKNTFPVGRHFRSFNNAPIPQPTFTGSSARSGPQNDRVGAIFTWDNRGNSSSITSRVGVSFISADKACAYKNTELASWDIQTTVQATRDEWNKDVFSKIRVNTDEKTGANKTRLALLYSSLYFMHLIPSERIGENPLWTSDEPYWDDFYTMWDLFRNQVSLWHLIQPSYYESMIRSLIDMWRHEGFLPDGRSGNYNGLVQGGSNADNVFADAYIKGLQGAINWTDGYLAVRTNAEVLPYDDYNPVDRQGSLKEGRSALDDWIPLGYVSADRNTRCVSKTVEYALNDFAISQIAAGLGLQDDRVKYLNRSAGWQRSWNHNATSRNFTGFVAPRFANGSWVEGYSLTQCGDCNWGDYSYEATPFEYSFVIPHDMKTLIEFMGGDGGFEKRLDYMFQPNTTEADLGVNGLGINTLMNIGNEPDFGTPYLYNYLNKQHKSVQRGRGLANAFFRNTTNGIPGNSDAGALNCWLIWQMLGLYPVVTQPVYLIQSPWFNDLNMTINHDKQLRIRAHSTSGSSSNNTPPNSDEIYVQRVTINGQPWNRNWFEHGDAGRIMVEGGVIEFWLGSQAAVWETGERPPSPGRVGG